MTRRKTVSVAAAVAAAALLTTGCEDTARERQDASKRETFAQQEAAVPYPSKELRDSQERRNLQKRLTRTNNPAMVQYVYLLGDTGTYIGYYVIKGKVSSNQSQMLPTDSIERPCGTCDRYVVEGGGDDGSFGENEPGIFFFTAEDVMVATDMRYIVSDAPLAVEAPRLNVPKR